MLDAAAQGAGYQPNIKDLIEFIVTEGLGEVRPGWENKVREGRELFRVRQLRGHPSRSGNCQK